MYKVTHIFHLSDMQVPPLTTFTDILKDVLQKVTRLSVEQFY